MQKNRTLLSIFMAALMLTGALAACTPAPQLPALADTAGPTETNNMPPDAPTPTPTPEPTPLPLLAPITPANAGRIQEFGAILPNQPVSTHLSADGSTLAVGDAAGIRVLDAATGDVLAALPLAVPDCAYGMGRSFRLNADGRFIALATGDSIQVWQVGGGRIYEAPYSRRYATDPAACGAELPQLALSPDGMTLAVSMVDLARESARQVFRIIDIPTNSVLSEWVAKGDGPQGRLYGYPSLGFSRDGSVLMTFDPGRFNPVAGEPLTPFRFWSVPYWQELQPVSPEVATAFSPGELLFPLSGDGTLQVLSRIDGTVQGVLSGVTCQADNPCPAIFSPNGRYLALLDFSADSLAYKRQPFAAHLQVWDIRSRQKIASQDGLWRDLEGVALSDAGELLPPQGVVWAEISDDGWWTYPDYFDGFRANGPGRLTFVPTSIRFFSDSGCTACGTCTLDMAALCITCQAGLADSDHNAGRLSVSYSDDGANLVREDASGQAEMLGAFPNAAPSDTVRLLAYAKLHQLAFYCIEKDGRQQGCHIVEMVSGDILASQDDIHQLRFSPGGQYAAFIDRTINAAFLMDLSSGKLTRMKPYQARALPAGAAFSPDGSHMAYLVQSTSASSRYYLEWVETASGKVLRRFDLRGLDMAKPANLAVSSNGDLWALGDAGGQILLLDTGNAALVHAWQAHEGEVLSLAFSQNGEHLVSMDRRGLIRVWGVAQ